MRTIIHLSAVVLGIASVVLTSPSHAVDRCNVKFEFDNRFDRPIKIERLVIKGNQGNQIESIRTKKVRQYSRHTTRKNRLQKLDDGHVGDFFVWARFVDASEATGNKTYILGTPFQTWYNNGVYLDNPGSDRYWAGRAIGVRKKVRCRDNDTIKFVIGPVQDTPQNRLRIQPLMGNPSKQVLARGNWLSAYFR